ncbi:MAG: hypothetical protein IJV40_06040 [Oscillospiraceae bacterium]|nr:hypothetical protein [Oscillospiraceae bacterium]
MSQKDCEMLDKFQSLPPNLQDKFLTMAQGASLAMDELKGSETERAACEVNAWTSI